MEMSSALAGIRPALPVGACCLPALCISAEPFHEYTHAEEGEAVMGKEYVGKSMYFSLFFLKGGTDGRGTN